jgi:hypothetical protein
VLSGAVTLSVVSPNYNLDNGLKCVLEQHTLTQQLVALTVVIVDALATRAKPLGQANGTTTGIEPLAVRVVLVLAHVARASCRQKQRSETCHGSVKQLTAMRTIQAHATVTAGE